MVTVLVKKRTKPTERLNRGNSYNETEKIGVTVIMNTQNNLIVY